MKNFYLLSDPKLTLTLSLTLGLVLGLTPSKTISVDNLRPNANYEYRGRRPEKNV